jgi:cell shape-determining protein MreD
MTYFLALIVTVYMLTFMMRQLFNKPKWWEFVVFVLLVALASWTAMMFAAEIRMTLEP